MHIHQLDTITNVMGLEIHTGHLGSRGQRVIFTKNAISPTVYMA